MVLFGHNMYLDNQMCFFYRILKHAKKVVVKHFACYLLDKDHRFKTSRGRRLNIIRVCSRINRNKIF